MEPLVHGYDELKLRIHPRHGAAYDVLASTGSAEASARFELPFGERELDNFIAKLSRPHVGGAASQSSSLGDEARRLGGELFRALFRDEVQGLYRESVGQARRQERGVRLTLCLSGSPELIGVPWEYLFDHPGFLAVSEWTPIVRYLDLPRSYRPLAVQPPLRVLGVISNPHDCEQLDVERERGRLERALAPLSDLVELHWLERPTLRALLDELHTQTFHALHYIGHGTYDSENGQGILLFQSEDGWQDPVNGGKLATVLRDFASLRLTVLNACDGARSSRTDPFAGVAGKLVESDIPAVVAMQFEISDEAAIAFGGSFYQRLAAGLPVDTSVSGARLAMFAERSDNVEWGAPVLFMRVPDGQLFDLESASPTALSSRAPAKTTLGVGSNGASRNGSNDALNVFINYRQDDASGHARLLAERLQRHFGEANVHLGREPNFDPPGEADVLAKATFLTLIGPGWVASMRAASASRHSEDGVRRDLQRALRDASDSLIPVLVGDTRMPEAEALPPSLRGLCRRQPCRLRETSYDQDVEHLITRIKEIATGISESPAPHRVRSETLTTSPAGESSQNAPLATAGIPLPYEAHYVDVINGMLDAAVVPVLGPGIRGSSPTVDHLATRLAEQFDIPMSGLSDVAQRIAVTLGERRLYNALKDLVAGQSEPTEVHRFLAEVPGLMRKCGLPSRPQLIISAGYDSGLERAFEDANEPFDYAVYLADSGWFVHVPWGERATEPTATTILEPRRYVDFPINDDGTLDRTIIVKIHGGVDGREGGVAWRNNFVVTEDHFIDYLPTDNIQDQLPIQILDKLTGSRCLFLGYVLTNWSARVFLRRIWKEKPISENSWAIEHDPDPLEKASWSARGHVELLAAAFPDYVSALRSTLSDRREDG